MTPVRTVASAATSKEKRPPSSKSAQRVPPEVVRSQPVCGAGRRKPCGEILIVRRERCQPGRSRHGGYHEDENHDGGGVDR